MSIPGLDGRFFQVNTSILGFTILYSLILQVTFMDKLV